MPCQARIQITTPRNPNQPENRPITAIELFPDGPKAIAGDQTPFSVYAHVPFCFHKCHYCDFYSIVEQKGSQDRQQAFTSKLIDEIHTASTILPQRIPNSIFIGGGTPTLLRIELWEMLLSAIDARFCSEADEDGDEPEFTVEANPETVTAELACTLAHGRVNRVSIGAQSFNRNHLKTLERWHEPSNVGRAVEHFRRAGITSVNLDLIFGIPGQSLADWLNDLDEILALDPTHLSCYGLTYEPNTALTARMRAGRISPIDDEVEAAMYEATIDKLGEAGFEHYEISAWAKSGTPEQRCRHNLNYWANGNWWPLGPAASGHWNGTRWKNIPRISSYLCESESGSMPQITDIEHASEDARIGEEFMLGLRLIDGMDREKVDRLLSRGRGCERARAIEQHLDSGLLEWRGEQLRLTRTGLLLADSVLAELI